MSSRGIGCAGLACLALAACATTPTPVPLLTVSATNCSAAPNLSTAAPLVLAAKPGDEKPVELTFDAQTSCLQSAAGTKSLYRVFALPADAPPYTIMVSAVPFGQALFAPHLMLLDGQGSMTREVKSDPFVFRGSQLTALLRNHADERYLLIASDPDSMGKQFARTLEETQVYTGSTGYGIYQIHTGTDTTQQMIYTANGNVSVTLAPLPAPQKPK